MANFPPPNTWQMMTFLELFDALILKIPFSFCRILGPGHLQELGVSRSRIIGGASIEPFGGGGRGLARGLYRPPPPANESPPSQGTFSPSQQRSPLLFPRKKKTSFFAPTNGLTHNRGRFSLRNSNSDNHQCWGWRRMRRGCVPR